MKLDLLPYMLNKIHWPEEPDVFYMILGLISINFIKWSTLRSTVDWIVNLFIERSAGITNINDCPLILPSIVEFLTVVTLDLHENIRIGENLIPSILGIYHV